MGAIRSRARPPSMPAPFPHHYKASLTWQTDRQGLVESPPRPALVGAAPAEFDGTDEHWSPEHLLVASLNLCLMLTFVGIAKKARLDFASFRSEAEGLCEKTAEGLRFTQFHVKVELVVASAAEVERARGLLDSAKRHCLVSNSLRGETHLEATVRAAG